MLIHIEKVRMRILAYLRDTVGNPFDLLTRIVNSSFVTTGIFIGFPEKIVKKPRVKRGSNFNVSERSRVYFPK